jgi:tRNA/tmRNA/rRNA uracil-C5-methylase (TrmA/RlmC/RlmD family)
MKLKVSKSFTFRRLVKAITPSGGRVEPQCSHKWCGGCQLMHLNYASQLVLKSRGWPTASPRQQNPLRQREDNGLHRRIKVPDVPHIILPGESRSDGSSLRLGHHTIFLFLAKKAFRVYDVEVIEDAIRGT